MGKYKCSSKFQIMTRFLSFAITSKVRMKPYVYWHGWPRFLINRLSQWVPVKPRTCVFDMQNEVKDWWSCFSDHCWYFMSRLKFLQGLLSLCSVNFKSLSVGLPTYPPDKRSFPLLMGSGSGFLWFCPECSDIKCL